MDLRKIKKLVEILEESGLAELEVHEEGESVRLSRYSEQPAPVQYAPMPAAPAPAAATPAPAATENTTSEKKEEDVPEGTVIRAPMVGTFYASPNPDADPFVRQGQSIKAGDTVCIIEAMKMFNQIESEVNGTIVSVLAENGQPVEFDQPLFIVR